MATASGCGDDEEMGGQPVYGIPIDASLDGGGADTGTQPDGGATTPDAGEPMAQPVYGVPIDAAAGDEKDAGDKDAEEPVAVPVYGVPIDAGADAEDAEDAEEPMAVPVYGIAIDDVER